MCDYDRSRSTETLNLLSLFSYYCPPYSFSLFVCLFGVYRPTQEFYSYGEVTIAGEGLKILTYAWHSWPLSSEASLACHTHCDNGHPFIMVISEDPWHSHLLPSYWQLSCHYLFLRLRSVATGDRTPTSRTRGERSNSTPPRRYIVCLNQPIHQKLIRWCLRKISFSFWDILLKLNLDINRQIWNVF